MVLKFEELEVLRAAEGIADGIWRRVVLWDPFARNVVGEQLAKAGDSIGANVAEAYGRFHYGEKLQFLYYARGSLFETKYWLNLAQERQLMPSAQVQEHTSQLTDLARQLNAFAADLKAQRQDSQSQPRTARETTVEYVADWPLPLFTQKELDWLQTTNI